MNVTRFVQQGLWAAGSLAALTLSAADQKPNVLMIMIDDHPWNLSDVSAPGPVPTPNIRRIAARGTWFACGYDDAPICCASRTALLTGVHATKSGVYYNNQAYRRAKTFIANVTTLPGLFKANGYLTAGYGKIGHNSFLDDDIGDYTPGYYKMLDHPADVTHVDNDLLKFVLPGSIHRVPSEATKHWAWGILPDDWDRDDPTKLQQDTEEANRAIALLKEKHDQPFFMICGFYRPHGPWTAPKRYFDKFPLDQIQLPPGYLANDLEDVPKAGRWLATNRREHAAVIEAGMWKPAIQAISACTSYVDDQVGRVLDALDHGPNHGNTIIIFATDNGFHTGEKDHWLKFALWEQTNRVLFGIAVPGMKPQRSNTPVGLIDIYPTLISLCGLKAPAHELDGKDLTAILQGRSTSRGEPVLSTYGRGNHSIRDDRYRYIRYRNGAEEFYDDVADPYEWTNLAAKPEYQAAKEKLKAALPKIEAADIVPPPHPALIYASWEDEAFKE